MTPRVIIRASLLGLVAVLNGCSPNLNRVDAGGATFPDPLIQTWAGHYLRLTGAEIDYVKKGSGYGIEQTTNRNFEFGCSDTPMSRKELIAARAEGGEMLHVPVTMGAVAVVYNLPDLPTQLRLSGPVLAEIYLRRVTRWDDPAIAALNPGAPLPDEEITPVARAESSGTTYLFAEYLAKVGTEFPKDLVSKSPKWPEGVLKQEGSDGVTSHVAKNPYCVGYVEVLYAKKNHVTFALMKNQAGVFTPPDPANVTAAAAVATTVPQSTEPYSLHPLTYSLTDAAGQDSYPIAGASYALLYSRQSKGKGMVVVNFLKWAVSDGQKFAAELEYAPLPADWTTRAIAALNQVTFE